MRQKVLDTFTTETEPDSTTYFQSTFITTEYKQKRSAQKVAEILISLENE